MIQPRRLGFFGWNRFLQRNPSVRSGERFDLCLVLCTEQCILHPFPHFPARAPGGGGHGQSATTALIHSTMRAEGLHRNGRGVRERPSRHTCPARWRKQHGQLLSLWQLWSALLPCLRPALLRLQQQLVCQNMLIQAWVCLLVRLQRCLGSRCKPRWLRLLLLLQRQCKQLFH